MFMSSAQGVLIEDNIFDHNGWYQQRPSSVAINTKYYGYATFFNHNIYIEDSSDMVIRNNLISRSSSIGIKFTSNGNYDTKSNSIKSKNIFLKNNLVVEGEVGFSLGGNVDFNNGYRWENIHVVDNLFSNIGRAQPTNRNIAWYLGVNDWKSGSVCGNYLTDQTLDGITNIQGISVKGDIGDVSVSNNSILNIGIETDALEAKEGINSSNNLYVDRLEENTLDSVLGFSSYETYITSLLLSLKQKPYQQYYDINMLSEQIKGNF
jgi:hypothetical protein